MAVTRQADRTNLVVPPAGLGVDQIGELHQPAWQGDVMVESSSSALAVLECWYGRSARSHSAPEKAEQHAAPFGTRQGQSGTIYEANQLIRLMGGGTADQAASVVVRLCDSQATTTPTPTATAPDIIACGVQTQWPCSGWLFAIRGAKRQGDLDD